MSAPAVAIYRGSSKNFNWKKVTFFYYMKDQPNFKKNWETKKGKVWCHGDSYSSDYKTNTERFSRIGNWVIDCISIFETDTSMCSIMMEDYALGAKGKVFEIAENMGILKYKLQIIGHRYSVVAPTTVKKFATGKGNSDKLKMYDAWKQETDNFDLWNMMTPNRTSISSPVTDIVDSYFLLKMAVTGHKGT